MPGTRPKAKHGAERVPADACPPEQAESLGLDFLEFIEAQPRQSLRSMLDRILLKSRQLCRAEAGTLFIHEDHGAHSRLQSVSVQNDRVRVRRDEFLIPAGPGTIAGYVAVSGQALRLDDVYRLPARRPYRFDKQYERPSYKTCSMFCFPLLDFTGRVNGVVQLLNARAPGHEDPVPFPAEVEMLVAPVTRIVGQMLERRLMLEKISTRNRRLRRKNQQLLQHQQRITELQEETEDAFQLSIRMLARAAELYDAEVGEHIARVNEYSYLLACLLDLPEDWCRQIRYSAQLHDVGKMSVDAAVLNKIGPLNAREQREMRRHTCYGQAILAGNPRLEMGAEIALNHHEKWDGSGYPGGKRGEQIPLSARIVQLADIYDALRSKRPYKRAYSHARAVRVITKGDERIDPRGHFDPQLLETFSCHHGEFARVWEQFRDGERKLS